MAVGWWLVGLPVLVVLVASGIGVASRQSWRLQWLRSGVGAAVMLMLVALVMWMVRVLPAVLRVFAPLVMPMARALQVMHWWMVLLVML